MPAGLLFKMQILLLIIRKIESTKEAFVIIALPVHFERTIISYHPYGHSKRGFYVSMNPLNRAPRLIKNRTSVFVEH
jgi:hypothetical protein